MDFSENLKQLLAGKEMKQADLCRMTGIQSSLMSDYLSGKKSPALSNSMSMAAALGVSLDELAGRKKEKPATTEGDGLNDLQREALIAMNQLDLVDMEIVKNLAVSLAKKHNQG